ncbi:hypothetical protein [Aequorivita lipolytica]|uniref:Uncharacterized protein n=1 Tax=Aequorivita lipolytica TaxID=153267 RepID=A0A5C6YPD2_9FLAO|nr:hypothetical protein [Aequorivita lipolytica]TXD69193.1 hypothetical protein ESV24_09140 [Aequorivita lipolytica]SRX51221.1 hypothetical protein AEQU2_01701 [Aequorivita lipolytica]
MKKAILSLAVAILTITGINAQDNKDVQSTTTVKKVTQKGTDVKTKVMKETETDSEIIQVEGTEKQDQATKVIKNKDLDSKMVTDDVSIDAANQQGQIAIKQRQEAELAKNIAEQKEKAAAEAKYVRQEKMMQQQKELEARRAELTNRPDGMAKLKKD